MIKSFLFRVLTCIAVILATTISISPASVHATTTDLLVKTEASSSVYYVFNGARYAFPNERVFFSWYTDYSSIQTISDEALASIPLRGNVTYRPGTRLVKITTDPRVYAVAGGSRLRWIPTEERARSLYGDGWASRVDDVPDAFFINYAIAEPINTDTDFLPVQERDQNPTFGASIQHTQADPPSSPRTPTSPAATSTTIRASEWHEAAMALPVTDYQRRVDDLNQLHLTSDGGKYEIILPNIGPDAEPFGRYALRQLKLDTEATQTILGRAPYLVPEHIVESLVINPTVRNIMVGGCCGSIEEGVPLSWYFASTTDYLPFINLGSEENNNILLHYWNHANGNHELVHRFIRGQMLYSMLDEGLANYLPKALISHEPLNQACHANGFIRNGTSELIPYNQPDGPIPLMRDFYTSGECFWDTLERTYGRGQIARVFDSLRNMPRHDLVSFASEGLSNTELLTRNMREVFEPVLGPSVWDAFAGFGARRPSTATSIAE